MAHKMNTNRFSLNTVEPIVDIIVLNWNGLRDTLECLESLYQSDYQNLRIIVVDNGSTDESVNTIQSCYSDVTLLETGQNLGYAEGNNVGIRHALENNPDYILVLNNDTIVAPNMISALVDAAQDYPNGVLGPITYYQDQPDVIWWAGTVWLSDQSSFTHLGDREIDNADKYSQIKECDYVVGSALFAVSNIYREIGLFDARYFLTFEETDWCYRAKQHGYRCYCIPQAKLWHKVSSSLGSGSPLQHYFYMRNALLWGERYLDMRSYLKLLSKSLAVALCLSTGDKAAAGIIRNTYWTIHGLINRVIGRSAHPISRANYLGIQDYLLRRFGDCPNEIREISRSYKANK
jgi:GT2 family glycosyltransferase